MATHRVTMLDVAARAGVSIATVSLVVNKNGFVSDTLKQRVIDAMKELGYQPNRVARSLRRQTTETIGVLVPTILSPFFPPILKEIENVLSAAGLSIILANTREDEACEASLISLMREKRVDGLLFAPHTFGTNLPLLEDMVRRGVPVVTFHHDAARGRLDCVTWDDHRASYDAVRHLIETGHRRVAILGVTWTSRVKGYEAALQDAGIALDPTLYLAGGSEELKGSFAAGRDAIIRAAQWPDPPDAVFISAGSDRVLGALNGARCAGIRIPDDLAIVAYADYPWMEQFTPPITVVARNGADLGRTAADLLLRRMADGQSGQPETIVLPTELVVRSSSGGHSGARQKTG